MFVNQINQAIDSIAYSKFINDKIKVKPTNRVVGFFLTNLLGEFPEAFEIFPYRVKYDIDIDDDSVFYLRKNQLTSRGDEVNPKFIVGMKKVTAYCLNFLAMNWVELERNESLVIIRKKYDANKISPVLYCNLNFIVKEYKLSDRVKICGTFQGVQVKVHPDYLSKFYDILKREAIQAHTSPAIHLFMCAKNDLAWMEKHRIPNEIIETIVGLNSLLISPCPVRQSID